MKLDGIGVGYVIGGLVLSWSGLKNQTMTATLKSLLAGKDPATVPEKPPGIGIGSSGSEDSTGGTSEVPPKASGGTYTNAQIRALWIMAGGSQSTAATAACIAYHESSYRVDATSSNPDGGTNVGLWQLDTKGVGAGHTVAQLQNPLLNARLTVQGTKNGTDWADWSTAPECGV